MNNRKLDNVVLMMRRAIRVLILSAVLFLLLYACIEPFTPDIDKEKQFIVIHGSVSDQEGYHYAEVSKSTFFSFREYEPINDCNVKIIDGQGNEFDMENYSDGKYRTWIEKQYLQAGNQYKIEVVLDNGDGKRYESEFDTLLPCPDIDSIYWKYENVIPDDPALPAKEGIQFYIDYDATGDFASNYRWEATETWEYNAEEKTQIIYYGISSHCCYRGEDYPEYDPCYEINIDTCWYWLNLRFLNVEVAEDRKLMDSLYTCWKTNEISKIYTYTSHQKSDKKVTGLPLYLVTNSENRLTIRYSILLKQFALSDVAFEYWNHLDIQSNETGGLYETQPYQIEGNISCVDNEEENVIGTFSASSFKSKRLTFNIYMSRNKYYCIKLIDEYDHLIRYLWGGEPGLPSPPNEKPTNTPIYLQPNLSDGDGPFSLRDQSCIDCRLKGGTLTKPDYW